MTHFISDIVKHDMLPVCLTIAFLPRGVLWKSGKVIYIVALDVLLFHKNLSCCQRAKVSRSYQLPCLSMVDSLTSSSYTLHGFL